MNYQMMESTKTSRDDYLVTSFFDPMPIDNCSQHSELWLEETDTQRLLFLTYPAPSLVIPKTAFQPAVGSSSMTASSVAAAFPLFKYVAHAAHTSTAPSTASSCSMAFFNLATRKLLAFNDAFVSLVEQPFDFLHNSGVRWDTFADSRIGSMPPETRSEFDESYVRMKVYLFLF